jgi:hypothetical protein
MRGDFKNFLIWSAGALTVIALERMNVPAWLLFLTAVVFVLVGISLDWFLQTQGRRVGLGLLGLAYVGVASWVLLSPPLAIYYDGKALNGQNIKLTTPTDRSRRQLKMFIDPQLAAFDVVGIYAKNRGNESLEADSIYLSFFAPISKWQANSPYWQASPDRNVDGWSTFRFSFGVNSIKSGHPLEIPDFLGIPVPTQPLKVRVTVIYGEEEATAEFTIRRP